MNKIICLLFIVLFSSMSENSYEKKEKIFYETISSFIKKKQKYGFEPGGIGAGEAKEAHNRGKHNFFSIMFHVDEQLTIESARRLSIQTVNEFLAHINANEKIRDNLVEYPLTEKYVYISIWGEDTDINDQRYIKSVSAGEGYVRYRVNSMAPPDCGLIRKETFEEAEKILREQYLENHN